MHAFSLPYPIVSLLCITLFATVHLLAPRVVDKSKKTPSRFLSFGGGVAIAYVFIDLLPKLCAGDAVVRESLLGFLPFVERHVFIMALSGFLLFFLVDRTQAAQPPSPLATEAQPLYTPAFALALASYSLFNFMVGYAVTYKDDPDIQPIALFTLAMALHYFTNDYTMARDHGDAYRTVGRWIAVASLFLGWVAGNAVTISAPALALVNAFIGGGVMMNVIRHELPAQNPNDTPSFLLGTAAYTVLLLSIGNVS